ncbi:baseplate J/gp47 family protein [Rhodopila sp.]|uniref:baseplate J/gp47 family protein n=1 Tax=Rhodopila sp. TaxID=2480087 RepID=UPI003D12347D
MTRAATSTGSDLDSWMADFGVKRLSANPSTGTLTFSRFAANLPALIPVGTVVKTSDGLLSFTVTEDTSLPSWQPSSSGYGVPSGIASADVPAACLLSGSSGNVLPNTITMIASSLPGVDQVSNNTAFTDGYDSETDQVFRARFQNYLSSLARATLTAVKVAIANVRQGLVFSVKENVNSDGTVTVGSFLVVIDDGSGYPSSDLLSLIATAVDAVRPIGTTFVVIPPSILTVNVSLTVYVPASAASSCSSTVQMQVVGYLNSLPIERQASVTRIAQSAYAANPAIYNVTNVTLNGLSTDVVPAMSTVVKAGQITVVVNAG